jgi:hypothetical protein
MQHVTRTTSSLLSLLLLISLGAHAQTGQQSSKHRPSEAEAIGIQKQFFNAMIARDAKAMEALSADDMAYVHLNGLVQTKAEFLSWVKNMEFKKFEILNHKVHAYDGAFVLNGIVENTRGMHLRLTTLWEQKPSGWQMVVLQYTGPPVAPPGTQPEQQAK